MEDEYGYHYEDDEEEEMADPYAFEISDKGNKSDKSSEQGKKQYEMRKKAMEEKRKERQELGIIFIYLFIYLFLINFLFRKKRRGGETENIKEIVYEDDREGEEIIIKGN